VLLDFSPPSDAEDLIALSNRLFAVCVDRHFPWKIGQVLENLMGNEYIFFDAALRDRFVGFLAARGISSEMQADAIEGFVVALADDLGDEVENAIEEQYTTLMEEQRDLVEAADGENTLALMAVAITWPDGQPGVVRIPARHARRLFAHFSVEEVHELVAAIAQSVANPVAGPLCHRDQPAPAQ
jgi:hypothetical protein